MACFFLQPSPDSLCPDPGIKRAIEALTRTIKKQRDMTTVKKTFVWGDNVKEPEFLWFQSAEPEVFHVRVREREAEGKRSSATLDHVL